MGLLLIAAAAIRVRGALNDLWLDEIWSLTSLSLVSSPLDVFTRIHLDNNNYLNTLWLYLCGNRGNWPGYRIPPIVAGVGCVIVAGLIGRRQSSRAALFAMFLVSFSYVQILYSSEARGYSEVVFFSFVSYYALDLFMETQDWRFAAAFSASSILGFAAHLVYLNFLCAAFLWSAWRFSRAGLGRAAFVKSMLGCYGAPAAFLAALYIVDIRKLVIGGGSPASLLDVDAESFAWAFGAAPGGIGLLTAGIVAVTLLLASLWLLWRQKTDSLVFFVGVILVAPILLLIHRSSAIYVRHFIIGMSFLLILFSFVLAALYQRGWQGRTLCGLLMAAYLIVNGWNTMTLFKYGRGQYSDAVRYLIQNTKGPEVTIGADHDFRISVVLRFYVDLASGDKTVNYYPRNSWPRKGPEWVIYHKESFKDPSPPQRRLTDDAGNSYEFVKTFPTAPLSGLHWFIYHNSKG